MQSEIVFDGFFQVRREWIKDYPYDTLVLKNDAVSVLVETAPGVLVLQWEFRYPVQDAILSTVGGLIDEGESPLDAAKREMLEETGYTSKTFTLLGIHYPFPGLTGQKIYVFLAQNSTFSLPPLLDPLEKIELEEIPFSSLQQKIFEVKVDGVLLSSLCYYQLSTLA